MSKVLVTKSKLDNLAASVSTKSGESLPLTLDEMKTAVDSITGGTVNLQTVSKSYTPSESSQSEAITYDSGYDGIDTVNVSVGAISSSYIGSGVTRRSSSDLSALGATVTAPAGYYGSSASKTVASGTEGTPTATKGTVSNHSVSVTPSVTNQTGFITGSTKTGTAVMVTASELDSGAKSITANGNSQDVVGYASVNVNVPNSYSASDEGKVVSSGALVSQTSATYTSNDTYDTTLINSVTVNVSGGGTGAISVVDTTDTAGGTIREITAIDISDTTAIASDVASGKYFYTAAGVKTAGTASGGGGISIDDIATASITGDIVITGSEIKAGAFQGNNGITSVTAMNATTIGENALKSLGNCTIKVPNVDTVGKEAFNSTVADLYLPEITAIVGANNWTGTGGAGTILALPGLTGSIPSDGLRTVNATILDLGYITEIKTRGIYQGQNKTVVILRGSSVVTASETNAIAALNSSTTVYVPSSLVSSYQSATEWSARGCTFTALEGSPYEDEDWAA